MALWTATKHLIDSLLEYTLAISGEKMLKLGGERSQGLTWNEVGNSEVVQILISHQNAKINSVQYQDANINSIQFVYGANGNIHHSKIHGKSTGLNFDMVTLDYPSSEFLTTVSGEYGAYGLASITFGTNKSKYGPFGSVNGKDEHFSYKLGPRSCFGGFHGTIDFGRVYSIGIYVKPIGSLCELDNEKNDKGASSKHYKF